MPRQELVRELQIREKQLMEELNAIRIILGTNVSDIPFNKEPQEKTYSSGTPKGKMSWEQYVELMLKEIGGKGKSQDVAKAVVEANPKLNSATILHAVRHHLSKLLKKGKIGADKSDVQSEGYEYFIKQ